MPDAGQARTWNMLCHLGCLAGLIVPFGSVLGPLIFWLIKRNEIPSVDAHGKAALNFQITIAIGAAVTAAAGFVLTFVYIGLLLFPVAALIGIAGLVFGVIAAVRASEGRDYVYPFSLKLFT